MDNRRTEETWRTCITRCVRRTQVEILGSKSHGMDLIGNTAEGGRNNMENKSYLNDATKRLAGIWLRSHH